MAQQPNGSNSDCFDNNHYEAIIAFYQYDRSMSEYVAWLEELRDSEVLDYGVSPEDINREIQWIYENIRVYSQEIFGE